MSFRKQMIEKKCYSERRITIMLNLNKESIYIGNFKNGKTQNIECRLGRRLYYIDIDKDCFSTYIELYKKVKKNRHDFSKYDPEAEKHDVCVKNNAVLSRDFFENMAEIERAQFIIGIYYKNLHNIALRW